MKTKKTHQVIATAIAAENLYYQLKSNGIECDYDKARMAFQGERFAISRACIALWQGDESVVYKLVDNSVKRICAVVGIDEQSDKDKMKTVLNWVIVNTLNSVENK